MKHSREHMDDVKYYANKMNIIHSLIGVCESRDQVDALKDIQFNCEKFHAPFYADLTENDTPDPGQEQKPVDNAMKTLLYNLKRFHPIAEIEMITQLTALKERLSMNNRMIKPKQYLDGVVEDVEEELDLAGFSETNIDRIIMPKLKKVIKGTCE